MTITAMWLLLFSKEPDHTPVEYILDECGDEIFKDADSIANQRSYTAREIVTKTFAYAEKYNKKSIRQMVSNMSIAVERP